MTKGWIRTNTFIPGIFMKYTVTFYRYRLWTLSMKNKIIGISVQVLWSMFPGNVITVNLCIISSDFPSIISPALKTILSKKMPGFRSNWVYNGIVLSEPPFIASTKKVVYMFVRDYYMKTEEIDYYLPPHSITLSSVRISPPIPYSVEYGIVLSSWTAIKKIIKRSFSNLDSSWILPIKNLNIVWLIPTICLLEI